jgi:chromosomal replication initiator protein
MTDVVDVKEIWNDCLEIIKSNIKEHTFNAWFKPIEPESFEDQTLTVKVPSQYFYEWISTHYNNEVDYALKTILGDGIKLIYKAEAPDSADSQIELVLLESKTPAIKVNSYRNDPLPVVASNLMSKYTFDNFVMGDNNRIAKSASLAIANKPGEIYNPFVIFGGVGLGKTHLIQAIGNEVLKRQMSKRVLYTSSEKFTTEFVDSLATNKTDEFSSFYRSLDLLIVDDIQFLAGKEKTQEVFFHTFNTLYQNNKQIILSCDRPPKDLKGLPDRLISRFIQGLSADIQPPDLETRIAILKIKSEGMNIDLSVEIIEYIALNITANIRELEGSLISILAESTFSNREIDLELVKDVVKKNTNQVAKKNISIDRIQKVVSEYYDIDENLLRDKTRKQEIAQARQIAMYLSKELTGIPLKSIGLQFGGRDHTTVIHACKSIMDMRNSDDKFRREIDEIKRKIEMFS